MAEHFTVTVRTGGSVSTVALEGGYFPGQLPQVIAEAGARYLWDDHDWGTEPHPDQITVTRHTEAEETTLEFASSSQQPGRGRKGK
jgi:hypothetical protein